MARILRLVVLVAAAAGMTAASAAAAEATTRTVVLRHGPVRLGGFQTKLPKPLVRTPRRTGYVVGMRARLVYRDGRPVSIRRVMLHHLVFINGARGRRTTCPGRRGQPFWGTGEERQRLVLPPGYGYRVRASDPWRMQAMLMSHSLRRQRVYFEYRVRIVTGRRLRPVVPLWLRAQGCTRHPSYDVDGEGGTHTREHLYRMPFSGRIVAAGAHLHGGARSLQIRQPRCVDRTLVHHDPRYGTPGDLVYRLRPVMHEPGPIATGYFLSRTGVPVRRGEPLRMHAVYDNSRPHPQVMAISHVYVAPGRAHPSACPPPPADRRIVWTRRDGGLEPPLVDIPFTGLDAGGRMREVDRPPGREHLAGAHATVRLRHGRFRPANLSVRRGALVTWRWMDPFRHNIFFASGPRAVAAPIRRRPARHVERFLQPGEYRLFCYLHPLTMHQVVRVRPD